MFVYGRRREFKGPLAFCGVIQVIQGSSKTAWSEAIALFASNSALGQTKAGGQWDYFDFC